MRKTIIILVSCILLLMCGCKANDTVTEPTGGVTTAPNETLPDGNSDFETPIDIDDGAVNPSDGQPVSTKPVGNGGKNDPIELPMIPG